MSAAAPSPRWVGSPSLSWPFAWSATLFLASARPTFHNGLLLPSSYACGAAPWWPRKCRAHFLRQGQVGMASPKVIIEEPPFDAFAKRFTNQSLI
jgi:hypothetical protein